MDHKRTALCPQAERSGLDANILSIPVPIRRGGSESNLDVVDSVGVDGIGVDFTKGALGIDKLQQKILKVGSHVSRRSAAFCVNTAVKSAFWNSHIQKWIIFRKFLQNAEYFGIKPFLS